MPRIRPKIRIEHLADAHGRLLEAQSSLQQVDLRTTRGVLREAIRQAREANTAALTAVEVAIRADTPG